MARPCTICGHPDRAEIDAALVAGASDAVVSKRFAASEQSTRRHRLNHVPTPDMQAGAAQVAAAERQHGMTLTEIATGLRNKAISILRRAETAGDLGPVDKQLRRHSGLGRIV